MPEKDTQHPIVGRVRWSVDAFVSGRPITLQGDFERRNIAKVHVPQLEGVLDIRTDQFAAEGRRFDGGVRFYAPAHAQLLAAFAEVEARGLAGRVLTYSGAFFARLQKKRGGGVVTTPSNHSFGTAFDVNARENPLGGHPPAVGRPGSVRELVPIFDKYGFKWGGHFSTPDGMHFEVGRLLSEQEIAVLRGVPDSSRFVPVLVTVNGTPTAVPAFFFSGRTWVGVADMLALLDDIDNGVDRVIEAGGAPFSVRVLVGGVAHQITGENVAGTGFVRFADLQPLYSVPFVFRQSGAPSGGPVLELTVAVLDPAELAARAAAIAADASGTDRTDEPAPATVVRDAGVAAAAAAAPGRPVVSRGARGSVARRVQEALLARGVAVPGGADGDYGANTASAVRAFQQAHAAQGLSPTGDVDFATWRLLTGEDRLPPLFERALSITAAFEGHGFTLAQGNFDGAGVTWGVIGFTLVTGDLAVVLKRIDREVPGAIDADFGAQRAGQLRAILGKSAAQKVAFANALSVGASRANLKREWKDAFAALGRRPQVQAIQLDEARTKYWNPSLQTAVKFGLSSELGHALAFDIHVQNGSVEPGEAKAIRDALKADPPAEGDEKALRLIIARAVADGSVPRFRGDVFSRKSCLATGSGVVHGERFAAAAWGLIDARADEPGA